MLQSEREAVAQEIHMLTTFASAQRFAHLNNSPSSSSRADADFLTINQVCHPPYQSYTTGWIFASIAWSIYQGVQCSRGVLDALETVFGSGEAAMAVACVIDYRGQIVNLIVSANRGIPNEKAPEILALWACLKRISNAALTINADPIPLDHHSGRHKIFNSPSTDEFAKDKRK